MIYYPLSVLMLTGQGNQRGRNDTISLGAQIGDAQIGRLYVASAKPDVIYGRN